MALLVLSTSFIIAIVLSLVFILALLLAVIGLVWYIKRRSKNNSQEPKMTRTKNIKTNYDSTTNQNTTASTICTGVDVSISNMVKSQTLGSNISVNTLNLIENTPNVGFTVNDLPLRFSAMNSTPNGNVGFTKNDLPPNCSAVKKDNPYHTGTISSSVCYNSLGRSTSSSKFGYDTTGLPIFHGHGLPSYRQSFKSQAYLRQYGPQHLVSHGPSMCHGLPRYQEVPMFVPIHWLNRRPVMDQYGSRVTPPVNPYMVSPLIQDGIDKAPSVVPSYGGWQTPVDYEKNMNGFTHFQY